jgi:pilus assembly protein Flp/PilA
MKRFMERAGEFLRSEDGPTATEYAVMLALIIAVVIGAVTLLGEKVSDTFNGVTDAIEPPGEEA